MTPGSDDLTAVTLPDIPVGHRWVIEKRNKIGYAERTKLCIALQEQYTTRIRHRLRWRDVEFSAIDPTMGVDMVGGYIPESMVECVERLAKHLKKKHIARLKQRYIEESISGIYEPGKNKALS